MGEQSAAGVKFLPVDHIAISLETDLCLEMTGGFTPSFGKGVAKA